MEIVLAVSGVCPPILDLAFPIDNRQMIDDG